MFPGLQAPGSGGCRAAMAGAGLVATLLLAIRAEGAPPPTWQVRGGSPIIRPRANAIPDIELTPGSSAVLSLAPREDVAIEAEVRFVERRPWIEAPIQVRLTENAGSLQAYLEQTGSQVMLVRLGPVTQSMAAASPPVPLQVGKWYRMRVVAAGKRVGIWVNGKLCISAPDPMPRAGLVGVRVGDAHTAYRSITVRAPYPQELRAMARSTEQGPTFEAGPFGELFSNLVRTVRADRSNHVRAGKTLHCNPTWVRDHIHEMKAYQYWEKDLNSFVDTMIELQHPDGFFYEILTNPEDSHLTFVDAKHRKVEAGDQIGWVRLEMEADVEYLMVEAAHRMWQATGDRAALLRRLPALARGINYCFTDPTRWDTQRGAMKRTFSIDTWDFTYGWSDQNRRIDPAMPMGIMHGDNSGLYQACRQLAELYGAVGDQNAAQKWTERAQGLRESVNRLCWNGSFYTHQALLQPVATGVREEEILSLSNAYDINRGLPTHPMAVSILDEYARRRQLRKETCFAEWFSIDPPYPQFGPYSAGSYINGGIASFTAGELAKAAFEHGREAYGADILRRVAAKVKEDGAIYFLYTRDGKNQGGGPSGWGAAAVLSAMVEGLAGIHDDGCLFRSVTISPRFAAAGIETAHVSVAYGPSRAGLTLDYRHDPATRTMRLAISGAPKRAHLRVLLPEGCHGASYGGKQCRIETVEQSRYACLEPAPAAARSVEICLD